MNHIRWLVDQILEFDPNLRAVSVDPPELSIEQWLALRIKWGIDRCFVWFKTGSNGVPEQAVCLRPINEYMLYLIETDYVGSIWMYDPAGEIAFIDFRFGVGSIPMAWDLCKLSGRKKVAYHHHQRVRLVNLEQVPRTEGLLHG